MNTIRAVGAVVNKKDFKKLRDSIPDQTPKMQNSFGFPIALWGGLDVFIKKNQRGCKIFYDREELRKYLK